MSKIADSGIERQQAEMERIVNERTGEVAAPSEYVENLRALDREIQRADDTIVELKADLRAAREMREKLVAQLRSAVREGKVLPLPLLEQGDEAADDAAEEGAHG